VQYGFVERQRRSIIINLGHRLRRWWKIKASAESAIHVSKEPVPINEPFRQLRRAFSAGGCDAFNPWGVAPGSKV
jgi:c-di-GMP-binding flagellar brake protein YcgR